MDIFRSLSGMVEGELTCADPGEALRRISQAGIHIYDVRMGIILLYVIEIDYIIFSINFNTLTACADKIITINTDSIFCNSLLIIC